MDRPPPDHPEPTRVILGLPDLRPRRNDRWLLPALFVCVGLGVTTPGEATTIKSTSAHSCKCGPACRTSCCCKPAAPEPAASEPPARPRRTEPGACLDSGPCGDPASPVGPSARPIEKVATLAAESPLLPDLEGRTWHLPPRPSAPIGRVERVDEPPESSPLA